MKNLIQNQIQLFQFESFLANGHIQHAVYSRQGGVSPAPLDSLNLSVSVPDDRSRVYANRHRAYGVYGRDTNSVVHAHLVHGAEVARVTQAQNGTWVSQVDGLVTNEPGCALTMNYADCSPIFLYDPINHAVGLGHAGWQGAIRDLPGAMVRAMQSEFATDPATLIAGIGPCIGACCYEVGEPVISAVHEAFAKPNTLLIHPETRVNDHSRPHFNLPEANRRNLARAGVQQIQLSEMCTACRTDLFFSHRAEKGRTGRFGALIKLA